MNQRKNEIWFRGWRAYNCEYQIILPVAAICFETFDWLTKARHGNPNERAIWLLYTQSWTHYILHPLKYSLNYYDKRHSLCGCSLIAAF